MCVEAAHLAVELQMGCSHQSSQQDPSAVTLFPSGPSGGGGASSSVLRARGLGGEEMETDMCVCVCVCLCDCQTVDKPHTYFLGTVVAKTKTPKKLKSQSNLEMLLDADSWICDG